MVSLAVPNHREWTGRERPAHGIHPTLDSLRVGEGPNQVG
jgi:hypothetical protein